MKQDMSLAEEIAVGLIAAPDGRVLLQHRDDTPGIAAAGLWGFFGGHIDPGETPEQAFLREMQEELGWRPRRFELHAVREPEWQGRRVRSHAFAAHLDLPVEQLVLGEGQAMALFAPDALPEAAAPGVRAEVAAFVASDAYKRAKGEWTMLTAAALIVDGDGRFLLQHRDDKPGIANPGLWGSFGGEIEPCETPDAGFLRELQEELAWRPASYQLYASIPYGSAPARQLIYIYTAKLDLPLTALTLGEGQDMAVFAPDALPPLTVPDLRLLIQRFVTTGAYRALADP